jgi:hypothetical protein
MGFEEFRGDYFTALSNAFSAAGNLPVFAAASCHLLTAGLATKIVSTVLDRVLNLGPVFRGTFEIPWSRAGKSLRKANLAVLFDQRSDGALYESHTLNDDGALVDKVTREEYDGLEPYMVISLDGRKNTGLEKFAPTAASAALLDQFYGDINDREQAFQPLVDALALYNDWMFRERALDLAKEIKETPEGPDRDALQQLYDAAIANIQNDILKPKKASRGSGILPAGVTERG